MEIRDLKLGKMKLEGFVKRQEADMSEIRIVAVGLGQAGGKMAQEMSRLGYPTLLFNTAQSDLDDITEVPNENKILLEGFGGASKDIARGQKAVEKNIPILAKALKNKHIMEADFVWLFTSLGGGTGNGGMPRFLEALYNLRKAKQYRNGQPTIGVVAAIPGEWEKRGLKENAVAGIKKLYDAIGKNKVGSVLLVDNDKLYNDFYSKENKLSKFMEWEVYGNTTVASMIFETAITTSLPATKSLDKSEILDIWSTPGFLSMGKKEVTNEIQREEMNRVIEDSFKNSGIFADEYNFERDAKIGGVIAIRPHNKIIKNGLMVEIERALNTVLKNARISHSGLIDNNIWGSTHNNNEQEKCIIYTLAVVQTLPKRVQKLVDEIKEAQRIAEEAKKAREQEGSLDLSAFGDLYTYEEVSVEEEQMDDNALFGITSDKKEEEIEMSDDELFGFGNDYNNDNDDDNHFSW